MDAFRAEIELKYEHRIKALKLPSLRNFPCSISYNLRFTGECRESLAKIVAMPNDEDVLIAIDIEEIASPSTKKSNYYRLRDKCNSNKESNPPDDR